MFAVIIYASQGDGVTSFQATAYFANKKIYGSSAAVFKTIYKKPFDVDFVLDTYCSPNIKNDKFWENVKLCSTFVTVSHFGIDDGPILAYQDPILFDDITMSQPWPTEDKDHTKLKSSGRLFWEKVGQGLSMKIVLLGCNSGVTYAQAVATAAKCDVFGFVDSSAAGNWASMEPHLTAVESGTGILKPGMVKRTPLNP